MCFSNFQNTTTTRVCVCSFLRPVVGKGTFPLPCPSRVCDHHVCAAGTKNAPNRGGTVVDF